ncbi:hypothetical protein, partial [Pseudomonas aeruginosa]|uniref:hypothetical protein n=1 Tax=Pseudomonas aeruginosa TaxID=287 RepID=UPI003D274526
NTAEGALKSLGIVGTPIDDTFKFNTKITAAVNVTKRHILSEIAKLFDPLGWLAPVVIKAKLLIQNLWIQQLDWDEAVNQKISKTWKEFQKKLLIVEKIRIPRWIHYETETIQLHGFCDASEKANGAMVYSRTFCSGKSTTRLLIAKSKVAPIKSR